MVQWKANKWPENNLLCIHFYRTHAYFSDHVTTKQRFFRKFKQSTWRQSASGSPWEVHAGTFELFLSFRRFPSSLVNG